MNATSNPVVAAVADASDEMMALEVASDIRKLIESAPPHIWLDLGENLEALTAEGTFRDLKEVTWSEDNATGTGIKYVRAPVLPTLRIDFKQATALLAMFGGEPTEITLTFGSGHSGHGLYAHYTEYPEEGAERLGATDAEAVPANPAQETTQAGLGVPGQRVASLRVALAAALEDLDATYKAATQGKPIEISIGQFARLRRMRAVLDRATKEQP